MTLLTATGSFAEAYTKQFGANIASIRELSEAEFIKQISQAETIVHNASTITSKELDTCIERNFDFTRFLIGQLETHNPNVHVVHISSMSVLSPEDETIYDDVLSMSPYAYSKYLAETYGRKTNLAHISFVRFSTLFYKNPEKDGLSKLISDAVMTGKITIYNGGEARRNFLPLDIAAQYVQKITVEKGNDKKPIYNLAAPVATSFSDIAQILKKHLPELEIEDKTLGGNFPVLADFSMDSVDALGRIDFSLEEHIANYINELKLS